MATLTPFPVMQFFDNNGDPLVGGKLYTYQAGGPSTPLATYTDASGTTPNANPVILDSAGRANIWLANQLYYWELTDSNDVQLWTADDVGSINSNADVQGPASAFNNAVARFDGVTGKIIQSSTATLSDAGDLTINSLTLTTDLPVTMGGTGASSASGARTNLGLGDLATKGDADFGDIVVSTQGTVWTIDTGAVTGTKIAAATIPASKLSGGQSDSGNAPAYAVRAYALTDNGGTFLSNGNFAAQTSLGTGAKQFFMAAPMPGGAYAVSVNGLTSSLFFFTPKITISNSTAFIVETYEDGVGSNDFSYYFVTVVG